MYIVQYILYTDKHIYRQLQSKLKSSLFSAPRLCWPPPSLYWSSSCSSREFQSFFIFSMQTSMQRYCQHIASCLMKSKIFPYCKILEQFMTHLVTFFPPVQLFLRHFSSSDPLIYSPKQSRQTLNRKWYNKIHHTYCKRNLLYITP